MSHGETRDYLKSLQTSNDASVATAGEIGLEQASAQPMLKPLSDDKLIFKPTKFNFTGDGISPVEPLS